MVSSPLGERPPVAVEERGQVHAGREAGERVPGVRRHHVERVHVRDADMGQHVASVAPVDLRRAHLEPATQPCTGLSSVMASSAAILGLASARNIFDPLVVAGDAVLGDKPLGEHRATTGRRRAATPRPAARKGRSAGAECPPAAGAKEAPTAHPRPVLTHRAPVTAALTADLDIGGACFVQGAETTNVPSRTPYPGS